MSCNKDKVAATAIALVSLTYAPFTLGLSAFGLLIAASIWKKEKKSMYNLPVVRNLNELGFSGGSLYGMPESPETALARLQPIHAMNLFENEGKRRLHASAVSSLSQTVGEMAKRSGCDVEITTIELYGFFGGVRGHRTAVRTRRSS